MERYRVVRRKWVVERISRAIEESGGIVVAAPAGDEAPFEFEIKTATGEALRLVCYAFTANEYRQQGRPKGEHRFQVKYGSEFDRPHTLFLDRSRKKITLMFGVHDERDLFIAVDPDMHNPTWFSSSIEFKEEDLDGAEKAGWIGWERDRVAGGRRQVKPAQSMRTETLLACSPKNFLTYVLLERIATGMDPGERLLLIDQIGNRISKRQSTSELVAFSPIEKIPSTNPHLLQQFGMTPEEFLEMISGRFRLMAAVRGGVAEFHLGKFLASVPGVKNVERIDKDGRPDFEFNFKGRHLRMECKNVLRRKVAGLPRVDFQKTRASKDNPCSRYYEPTQFEVLAACLHPLTVKWEFEFAPTHSLEPHQSCRGRLSEKVQVGGGHWSRDLVQILKEVLG